MSWPWKLSGFGYLFRRLVGSCLLLHFYWICGDKRIQRFDHWALPGMRGKCPQRPLDLRGINTGQSLCSPWRHRMGVQECYGRMHSWPLHEIQVTGQLLPEPLYPWGKKPCFSSNGRLGGYQTVWSLWKRNKTLVLMRIEPSFLDRTACSPGIMYGFI